MDGRVCANGGDCRDRHLTVLLNPEPKSETSPRIEETMLAGLKTLVVAPLADFFSRPRLALDPRRHRFLQTGRCRPICDANPVFLELEFTKPEIAGIKKGSASRPS